MGAADSICIERACICTGIVDTCLNGPWVAVGDGSISIVGRRAWLCAGATDLTCSVRLLHVSSLAVWCC